MKYIEWDGSDKEMCAKMAPKRATDEFKREHGDWFLVGEALSDEFYGYRYRRLVEENDDTKRLNYLETHPRIFEGYKGSGKSLREALDAAMTRESAFEKWMKARGHKFFYDDYNEKDLREAFEAGEKLEVIYTAEQKAKIDAEEAMEKAARLAERGVNGSSDGVNSPEIGVNSDIPSGVNKTKKRPGDRHRAGYMAKYMRKRRQ